MNSNTNPPVPVLGLSIAALGLLAIGYLIIANGAPLQAHDEPVTVSQPLLPPASDHEYWDAVEKIALDCLRASGDKYINDKIAARCVKEKFSGRGKRE